MMIESISQSLNAIYGWPDSRGEADYPLVKKVNACLSKRFSSLEGEDIRLLVSQQLCLDHVADAALAILEANPLSDTIFYPGDLLKACLTIDSGFWSDHPQMHARLAAIATRLITDNRQQLDSLHAGDLDQAIKEFLNSAAP